MSYRRNLAATALLVAVALSIAACGGGSDSSSTGGGGSTDGGSGGGAAKSTAKGSPVKVMLIGAIAGSNAAAFPDMVPAAEAAAAKINSEGGVGVEGNELELVTCDDKIETNAANACARQAVQEGVAATIGNYTQAESSELEILEAAEIPAFAQFPLVPTDYTSEDSYPIISGYGTTFLGIADVMSEMGIENASVMEYGGNAASQLSTKFFLAGAESFGLGVNDPIEIEPGVPDVTAPVAKADSNGATGITFTIGSPDVAKLLPEVKATASDLQVVTLASQVPSALASSLGESAEGVRTVSSFPAQSSPLGQEYQEELNEFAGDPESIEFNDQALNIMSGYALFQQLVKGLKSVTGPEVIKALGEAGTMKDRAITYNPNTPPPLPSLPRIRNVLQYEGVVEGGQIESAQAKPFDPINSKLELGL